MDQYLADLYGTNKDAEGDVEKLAAAEMAEKLAAEEGIDLSQADPDEIEALAAEVLASDSAEGEEEEAAAGDAETEEAAVEEPEKTAAVQDAEYADYMGRVMAHAFHQEKTEIEKAAGAKDIAAKAAGKLKGFAAAAKGKAAPFGAKAKAFGGKAKETGGKVMAKSKDVGKKHGKGFAAGAAAGGAAGYFGKKEKKSSALDTLAEQRALEVLTANGYAVNDEGEIVKTASEDKSAVLKAAVEARAEEMLREAGFTFEGDEAEAPEEK